MEDALILDLASLATRVDDPDEALGRILSLVAEALQAAQGAVWLMDPDSSRIEVEARFPASDGGPTPGSHLGGRAVFQGRSFRDGAEIAVPLFSAEAQPIGAVCLARPPGGFAAADQEKLERWTGEAGRVLHRLWQLQHLRDKARQLETLLGAGQAIVAKLDEKDLCAALARDARRLMQAQACVLYLHDAATETMRVGAVSDTPAPALDSWPLASSVFAAPIRTRKPVAYSHLPSPQYFDLADFPPDPLLRSALAIPLIFEGEALGVLAVFFDRVRRFDNDEKRLGRALASLGAVAIQNARLYARVFQGEEALRKNERLTMLGLVAAEIAHEIRNPLTVLKLLHGGLGGDYPEGDPRRTDLRIIGEKLNQLESIVTRVLNFGRAPGRLHTRCSFSRIVEDTLAFARLKLVQNRIQLAYDPPAQSAVVDGNEGELQQALLNVLLNAVDAMPQGGEIRVAGTVEGGMAALTISDTGPGIPEAVRRRLFEPFLSGRPEGTGLGLAITKRLLASHHGDIALLATGPKGTTFKLTLPLV